LFPNDIETITVLKMHKQQFTVLLVLMVLFLTTKTGKRIQSQESVSILHRFSRDFRKLNLLNATEYALLLNESYANGGNSVPFSNVSGLKGTNWQKRGFNKGVPILIMIYQYLEVLIKLLIQ
jgi:hypothetical protein